MQIDSAPRRGAPALQMDGIGVTSADGVPLLRGIDWTVRPGEHWAVLGPNGAGKTTLLRVAAGRLAPTEGSIAVLGGPLGPEGLGDPRLRIGVIEGRAQTFANQLTVAELMVLRRTGPAAVLGARIPRDAGAHAHDLLELFGCAHLADRRFASCSEGERQRVLLARALMRDPALVLLDEPAVALDLPGREDLVRAMGRLARERPTIATAMVVHHLEELPPSTTHALLLNGGRAVVAGPTETSLTETRLSDCFGAPISLTRLSDRWVATMAPSG
jgi:iron complex transport system ATP-binding protein